MIDMELKKGEWCVFRRDFYIDSGEICICHGELSDDNKPRETVTVIRRAELLGMPNVFTQEEDAVGEEYVPPFDMEGV